MKQTMKTSGGVCWIGYTKPVTGKEIEQDAKDMIERNGGRNVYLYLNLSDMLFELKNEKKETALISKFFRQVFIRPYSKTDF